MEMEEDRRAIFISHFPNCALIHSLAAIRHVDHVLLWSLSY